MISGDTLGAVFLKENLITGSGFEACMDRYLDLQAEGASVSLCQIVLEFGFASVEDISRVVETVGIELRKCPDCKLHFAVESTGKTERPRCPVCRTDLKLVESSYRIPAYGGAKADPLMGLEFGGFRLLKRLGEGATGTVYLAENESTGVRASIKVLSSMFDEDPNVVNRFKREALTGDRLDHPSFCKLLASGEEHGRKFLALEYADGDSLEEFRSAGLRMDRERAVKIIRRVLEALQHAHDNGISHRDIKPENVIITRNDEVTIIDFGVARDDKSKTTIREAGLAVGTPLYMSPEQAKGERGGPVSDIHACGCLLFILLTGRRPFEAHSVEEALIAVEKNPVPEIPDISPALDAVLRKMMAKEPGDRYATASEASRALENPEPEKEARPGCAAFLIFPFRLPS